MHSANKIEKETHLVHGIFSEFCDGFWENC